jgi:hypothetical protein
VLVVAARPLDNPVRLARLPEYAGCRSWVQVPVTAPFGAPVHDAATLDAIAERVRQSLG